VDIQQLMADMVARYYQDLEMFCERSLTDGRGVLVIMGEKTYTMSLSEEVPWGQIHIKY
jgi:hypothetical protein